MMGWTDTHCHIPYDRMEAPAAVVDAARAAGVTRLVTVGTDAEHSALAVDVANTFGGVWATVGLHPHEATQGIDAIVRLLDEHAASPLVVAVGECGLDYHYDHSPRDVQRAVFAAQVALANRHDLALVVHTREAFEDTWAILRAEGVPARTVFHCFTGGPEEARGCLNLGGFLSFSGIVTFKKADDVRAAARLCPLEQLLVETDSPFLAPEPHRGATNSPALLPVVGASVAAAKGLPTERVEEATTANAELVLRLTGSGGPV